MQQVTTMTSGPSKVLLIPTSVVSILFVLTCVGVEAKQCLKDQSLPAYPVNTYDCDENSTFPECCEQNDKFTCCQSQDTHAWVQQVILWGCLVSVVAFAIIAWLCFRKDTNMCERGKRCCEGCCGRFGKKYEKQYDDLTNVSTRPTSRSSQHHCDTSHKSPGSPLPLTTLSSDTKSRLDIGSRSLSVSGVQHSSSTV